MDLTLQIHFDQAWHDAAMLTLPGPDRRVRGESRLRYPSLWLPRFDMRHHDGVWTRYGLESVYSLMGAAPGTFLRHGETLRRLLGLLQAQHRVRELGEPFEASAFVIEWVRRDLLNIAFGNSDNDGRNTALLKRPEGIWLSPVYDFAPMRADPEGVTRTTQWGPPLEAGGEYDWYAIAESLSDLVDPEQLMEALRRLAADLNGLDERLAGRGVPTRILDMPSVGLRTLGTRLKRWGLL
ncbi:HipA domain-containing protein [Halomonas sp.]|uniref:HipA domain-containing protein n=1 Tax=Halomonas sp. TaxID=1486246 RepID=UPI0025BF019D|nr:HipA domain-containing protein [Halomonas sp.]